MLLGKEPGEERRIRIDSHPDVVAGAGIFGVARVPTGRLNGANHVARARDGHNDVIGPLKGVGMTLYRAFIGATEAVFFPVPQPGYYDPMIDPDFVWKGWEPPQRANGMNTEEAAASGQRADQ